MQNLCYAQWSCAPERSPGMRRRVYALCVAHLCGVSADTQEDAQALLPAVFGRSPHGRVAVSVGRAGIYPARQQNLREVDRVSEPAMHHTVLQIIALYEPGHWDGALGMVMYRSATETRVKNQ
eukprot:scaffold269954_cov16-Prasinocladus_malaysianus.AAC.1